MRDLYTFITEVDTKGEETKGDEVSQEELSFGKINPSVVSQVVNKELNQRRIDPVLKDQYGTDKAKIYVIYRVSFGKTNIMDRQKTFDNVNAAIKYADTLFDQYDYIDIRWMMVNKISELRNDGTMVLKDNILNNTWYPIGVYDILGSYTKDGGIWKNEKFKFWVE